MNTDAFLFLICMLAVYISVHEIINNITNNSKN